MTVRRYPVAILLVVVTVALVVVNGFAPWGDTLAQWVDDAMQLSAGVGAVVCGVLVARRVRGHQRWWRVLVATGMAGWSLGQCVWSWYQLVDGRGLPSPSPADVGYLSFPVFALAALIVLARARVRPDRERWQPAQWTAHFGVAVVLDGLVVTGSLFILTWTAALGQLVRATAPDALTWAVAIAYPLSDLVIVVVAVLLVVFDRVDRPYRANLLLAAVGIVALACSDSVFAYLVSIGAESMKPWSDGGFVLGPLFIAFALLVTPNARRRDDAGQPGGVDWWQLALPYVPVTAVALLITVQLLAGAGPDGVEVFVGVLVVFLVLARQLLSLLDNRLLLRRVYEGQQQLTHQAYHDPLTGLANRALFADRLDRAVEAVEAPLVLIFVDLDDFKEVNDRFGHAGGDVLLHAVAQRLLSCVRSTDTVARLGGDEFAILLEGEPEAPQAVADRIQGALRRPFAVHGTLVSVRASMGLVVPDPAEPLVTADVLLGRADSSMYAGKRLGKDTTVVYQPSQDGPPDFPTALRRAAGGIPEGFGLVFQPIVRLADEAPVALEALARWTTRDGTAVSPETFVRAAEGAGLGAELDALVLDLACREITAAGLDLTVHVNVCASRLGAATLERSVAAALDRYGLPASRLVVEITETVPVPDLTAGAAAIRRLQELGVRVALDDFGAGYSSLTVLHALPVDLLKLDRALTTGIQPERDAALCRSLVGLCADLDLAVVAEGIETAEQAELVTRAGCTSAQGYRFGRPAPLPALRLSTIPAG
ncbi:putative bifunctional diguanylate cyclase/phosphodiesterase [Amycolatopsis australiensis]|uniref:Diguanylate cyclase (GGDEF) domain-containing protein n=1 Tax=Amycolatopsis australiensis TaxID=546364 RepID=A0A1K1RDD4_9PSEU|nr:bifunctional diguanylate cyclase/phosphodiesterase [Amycolatopsis australiensis]SFW69953.1 diguanylate cyclase (GGDEF) domain-containing protein [Amycolatopsis australiensis]